MNQCQICANSIKIGTTCDKCFEKMIRTAPPTPAPSCSPKTTTDALQCQQRLTQPRALHDACRKVTLAVIADLIAKGKLMPTSSEAKAIIEQKPAEYRLLDHNDVIRESDQFDDDGDWASIAQYSWFIGNHWNTALKPMRREVVTKPLRNS